MTVFTYCRGAVLGACLLSGPLAPAQSAPPAATSLATAPLETLSLATAPSFRLFDRDFYRKELFLLGEAHGVQAPQALDFALLRHLNQRVGVRYYLAEVDAAKAFYLNEYLRTGEESTLRLVFRSWVQSNAQWANQDFLAKIQQIRALNATLPARRQIRFLGIDELQDAPLAGTCLRALLPAAAPPTVRGALDSVATLLQAGAVPAAAVVARRAMRLLAQPASRRALGPHATADLTQVLATATGPHPQGREAVLFANFECLRQDPRFRHEKMYGLWGLYHVLQSPLRVGGPSFAARVRQSSLPLHDKVVSVLCVFAGCQMLFPTASLPTPWQAAGQPYTVTNMFNHDGPLVTIAGLAELKARTAPRSLTLLPLRGPQPLQVQYAPGLPPAQRLAFDEQRPARDYVQYLVLVRGSGPVVPLPAAGAVSARP